jgi:hypothetical protein
VVASRGDALASATDFFIDKHFRHRRTQRLFAALHRGLPYLRL